MESLHDVLKRIKDNLVSLTGYPMDTASSEASPEACHQCHGLGFMSVRVGEWSSRVITCPVCKVDGHQNFFADLEVFPGNQEAIAAAKAFASHPVGWLVLKGDVGVGKTRLLNGILSQWVRHSRQALTSAELLDLWRSAVDENNFGPVFHDYCSAPAFVLDDLGVEKPTDWALERLTMFLDYRYSRALPTAIATNYTKEQMGQRLNNRIADRVYDEGTGLVRVVALRGISFRTKPEGR